MALETTIKGTVSRRLPQSDTDNQAGDFRLSRYGDQLVSLVVPTLHNLADEGTYFTTQNPTLGTALALPVVASFADTAATFVIYNLADISDPGSPYIYLSHIKMAFTVAPATATGTRYACKLDQSPRTPTAGFSTLVGQGGSPGGSPTGAMVNRSFARIYAFTGAAQMTVPAATAAARVVANGGIDGIPVVGGERTIIFGASDGVSSAQSSRTNPIAIAPGWSLTVYVWFPGNATTGASLEPEISWFER